MASIFFPIKWLCSSYFSLPLSLHVYENIAFTVNGEMDGKNTIINMVCISNVLYINEAYFSATPFSSK